LLRTAECEVQQGCLTVPLGGGLLSCGGSVRQHQRGCKGSGNGGSSGRVCGAPATTDPPGAGEGLRRRRLLRACVRGFRRTAAPLGACARFPAHNVFVMGEEAIVGGRGVGGGFPADGVFAILGGGGVGGGLDPRGYLIICDQSLHLQKPLLEFSLHICHRREVLPTHLPFCPTWHTKSPFHAATRNDSFAPSFLVAVTSSPYSHH
jgi:hypothetical protein